MPDFSCPKSPVSEASSIFEFRSSAETESIRAFKDLLYHGVRHTPSGCLYRLGLALFDLENPEKCLLRGDSWIFGPEADYERHGDVDDVVFPCGYTIDPDGDALNIYYGAADCAIALARSSIRALLHWLDDNGSCERRRAQDR